MASTKGPLLHTGAQIATSDELVIRRTDFDRWKEQYDRDIEARSAGNRDETGLLPGERAALDQLRALRITGDQIDAAIEALGPTGDLAEAYVKVAAGATAAALRALAPSTTTPEAPCPECGHPATHGPNDGEWAVVR